MFNGLCYLKNLKGLEKWNVSNVKKMSGMFYGELLLENLDELKIWKTFKKLGLEENLSPARRNGFAAMIERIYEIIQK